MFVPRQVEWETFEAARGRAYGFPGAKEASGCYPCLLGWENGRSSTSSLHSLSAPSVRSPACFPTRYLCSSKENWIDYQHEPIQKSEKILHLVDFEAWRSLKPSMTVPIYTQFKKSNAFKKLALNPVFTFCFLRREVLVYS